MPYSLVPDFRPPRPTEQPTHYYHVRTNSVFGRDHFLASEFKFDLVEGLVMRLKRHDHDRDLFVVSVVHTSNDISAVGFQDFEAALHHANTLAGVAEGHVVLSSGPEFNGPAFSWLIKP